MTIRRWTITLAIAGMLALGAVACGGDDDEGAAGTPTRAPITPAATSAVTAAATSPATVAATPAATEPAGGGTIEVAAADFSFSPKEVKAVVGVVKITLTNTGSAPHTLTLFSDAAHTNAIAGGDTGRIAGGASGEISLDLAAGLYFFRCQVHPAPMQGTLTVE